MGYTSEVKCLIFGDKDKLEAFMTYQALIAGSPVFRDFKDNLNYYEMTIHNGNVYHVLEMYEGNTKWYPQEPDIKAWINFMREAPEMGLDYEFIRVGEEAGDIDQENSGGRNYLYVTTPQIVDDYTEGKHLPMDSWGIYKGGVTK